jgi:hypothetical protein
MHHAERHFSSTEVYDHLSEGGTFVGSFRQAARRVGARHPAPFMAVARRRHPQSALATDTQIVIDCVPRSAGTFALIAFQITQNSRVRVAHHLHAAAHVVAAVRAGVPTLVPIRPPRDTVLSCFIRQPDVSIEQWLRSYCDFYRQVQPQAEGIVFATFESVVGDLGRVIRTVNDRFGTSFAEFRHSDDDVEAVLALIEERASRPTWQRSLGEFLAGRLSYDEYEALTAEQRRRTPVTGIPEARAQRPSAWRSQVKSRLIEMYEAPAYESLRLRADEAYATTASGAC